MIWCLIKYRGQLSLYSFAFIQSLSILYTHKNILIANLDTHRENGIPSDGLGKKDFKKN
jgi:hypothetical protein